MSLGACSRDVSSLELACGVVVVKNGTSFLGNLNPFAMILDRLSTWTILNIQGYARKDIANLLGLGRVPDFLLVFVVVGCFPLVFRLVFLPPWP